MVGPHPRHPIDIHSSHPLGHTQLHGPFFNICPRLIFRDRAFSKQQKSDLCWKPDSQRHPIFAGGRAPAPHRSCGGGAEPDRNANATRARWRGSRWCARMPSHEADLWAAAGGGSAFLTGPPASRSIAAAPARDVAGAAGGGCRGGCGGRARVRRQAIATTMGYWGNFARTGDPNGVAWGESSASRRGGEIGLHASLHRGGSTSSLSHPFGGGGILRLPRIVLIFFRGVWVGRQGTTGLF